MLHWPVIDRHNNLIVGERRVRAAQWLGWTELEVRVFDDLTETERREIELEENIQRKDLTDYERNKRLVEQGVRLAPIISGNLPEKDSRGRKPVHEVSKAELATALGRASGRCGGPNNTSTPSSAIQNSNR